MTETTTIDPDEKTRKEQAETRAFIDGVLAKRGWKLGTVGVREKGMIVSYELIREVDQKKIYLERLLSEVAMASVHATMNKLDPKFVTLELCVLLLIRIGQEL